MKKFKKMIIKLFIFLTFVVGVIFVSAKALGLVINTTQSIPMGIYMKDKSVTDPTKGGYVSSCLTVKQNVAEAKKRRYVGNSASCPYSTMPILKIVIATRGDVISIDKEGIYVNGEYVDNSKPLLQDGNGREMMIPSLLNITLNDGEYVVHTPVFGSFDSRYIGVLNTENYNSMIKPVLFFDDIEMEDK